MEWVYKEAKKLRTYYADHTVFGAWYWHCPHCGAWTLSVPDYYGNKDTNAVKYDMKHIEEVMPVCPSCGK